MKKAIQATAGVMSAGITLLLSFVLYIQSALPNNFYVAEGEEFYINSRLSLSAGNVQNGLEPKVFDSAGNCYNINLNLFRSIPVKEVQVQVVERRMVVPGGTPFGIKMFTDGVMIVGMSDIQIGSENVNPAKEAGLRAGDILTHINDEKVEGNSDVARQITESNGTEVKLAVNRDGDELEFVIQPVKSDYEKVYRAGIWVRDSSAGIGTMTYYDPQSGGFAGLGHAVCDVDTGEIMPLESGVIVDVNISGVNAGESGRPGELKGFFSRDEAMGQLTGNRETGVFGVLDAPYFGSDPVPMALKQEVEAGPAVILSTISGNKPQQFEVMIEKVNYLDSNPTKNMVIRITDEKLLAATGGIVQGMSGSPILQNGKLVGAITHVFVNDPGRGYGIFAENMDKSLNYVENDTISA